MKRYLSRINLNVTPLVAYGLIVLLLILGALGLEKYNSAQQALEVRLKSRQSELATLKAIKNTDIWPARLAQSLELKKKAEDRLWSGRTSGVIAAQLQQVIRSISKTHDVTNVVVSVDPQSDTLEGIEILRFEFNGRIASGKDTIDFFADLTSSTRWIIMTELTATNSIRDNRRTYMTLSGLIPIAVDAQPAEEE